MSCDDVSQSLGVKSQFNYKRIKPDNKDWDEIEFEMKSFKVHKHI